MPTEEKTKLYETMVLFVPDLEEQELDAQVKKTEDVVAGHGGRVLNVHRWKKRKLAYPVNEFEEGFYVVYRFAASRHLLSDLDYVLRYNERCLRYLILDLQAHPGMLRRPTEEVPE